MLQGIWELSIGTIVYHSVRITTPLVISVNIISSEYINKLGQKIDCQAILQQHLLDPKDTNHMVEQQRVWHLINRPQQTVQFFVKIGDCATKPSVLQQHFKCSVQFFLRRRE